tara:strand:+ start:795 stop:1025 length:231 start_codon:yes stop_codon:yes gene_type:complete
MTIKEIKISLADKIYEDIKNGFETGDTSCFYETLVALENTKNKKVLQFMVEYIIPEKDWHKYIDVRTSKKGGNDER